ncbi:MAG: hypothetical protein ABJI69_17235 [Balneola sp.]
MPLITRLFLKAGLVFLFCALITGILLQLEFISIPIFHALFWHMLMLGWITQIIIGVSLWMFPGRIREESFSNQKWSWIAFGCLNSGLLSRIIAEPFIQSSSYMIWKILLITSAILQFIAIGAYLIEIWPRVKGKKKRTRKQKGESV